MIAQNSELARPVTAVVLKRQDVLVVIHARDASRLIPCVSLVLQRSRSEKSSPSSKSCNSTSCYKLISSSYVRTLEMQQFKLAAGLQTMCFMLLAAKAWPGTQIPEHKGNALVHDVLDGLGLLEHKDGQDIDFGSDEHEIDTQYSSAREFFRWNILSMIMMQYKLHRYHLLYMPRSLKALGFNWSSPRFLSFPKMKANSIVQLGHVIPSRCSTTLYQALSNFEQHNRNSIEATVQDGRITSKQSTNSWERSSDDLARSILSTLLLAWKSATFAIYSISRFQVGYGCA